MSQEIEIEFKNLLTKEEYEKLLAYFHVSEAQIIHQENHYFDTPDFHLKNQSSGLRIRVLHDHIECTLKERTSDNTHLETTEMLSADMAANMIRGTVFVAPAVEERLQQLHVPIDELQLYGSLETNRVELSFKGGTLVLDQSFYLQSEDYEVEYETNDEQEGFAIFHSFLEQHHIPKRHTPKKIARFTAALAQQFK